MNLISPIRSKRKGSEEGYVLLGVLILLAIFVIVMAVSAPKVAQEIQRDRELETMERGRQYIRAVQLYYRKFQAYPPNIDALVKTNETRFLRKKYLDPLTGKDDWKPIMYCQNKAPIAMGFFGQPLGPASGCGLIAGTGPSGGNGVQGGNSIFGQNGSGSTNLTSPTGTSPTSTGLFNSSSGTSASPSPTITNGPPPTVDGQSGTTSPTSPTSGATGSTSSSGSSTSGGGLFGDNQQQTFGGGGIIGVSPPSDKKSLLIYKKKDHYNQWEFTYGPQMEMQGGMSGGNAGSIGTPMGGAGNGIGTTMPGGISPTSPTSGSGSTPIQTPPTTSPVSPQQ